MTQPHSHIVKSHDEERNRVISEILRMGSMAAAQLEAALDVLERRDDKAAERIIGNDEEIDKLEREISQDAMTLALRGPLARDLREILATLRIVSDIERIGDYAANAAKRSIALNTLPPLPHTRGLQGLGTLAVQQLRAVLEAYRDNDPDAAQRVRARCRARHGLHQPVPRAADLHDGRRARDHAVHAPAVHRQEPRTRRRPRPQNRREHLVTGPRRRAAAAAPPARRAQYRHLLPPRARRPDQRSPPAGPPPLQPRPRVP